MTTDKRVVKECSSKCSKAWYSKRIWR